MKPLLTLLACLTLAAALPAAALPAAAPLPAQTLATLKLTDGHVLKQASINATTHDYVMVKCTEGIVSVPYELFPPDLRRELENVRPAQDVRWKVTGAVEVKPSAPLVTDPMAPAEGQKFFFPGRIFLTGTKAAGTPLPAVIVYAVRPADFAAYNLARLAAQGPAIDDALKKWLEVNTRAKSDAKLAEATRVAMTDAQLTVFASFEKPPPAVAVTGTDENGHFTLACEEKQVVLVARTTVPAGDDFIYLVWAVPAMQGAPTRMDDTNPLMR